MTKILITDPPINSNLYEELGDVMILTGNERVDAELLDTLPDFEIIGCPRTAPDALVDLEECKKRGVKVISLKGEAEFLKDIPSVAELVFWMMLELLRRPHNGRFLGSELYGKTLGLIGGKGRIGIQVAERARAFGMNVIIADKGDSLEKLLAESDIISLHASYEAGMPPIASTIDFKACKPSSMWINSSRPLLIQPGAVYSAIVAGDIAGYSSDFLQEEQDLVSLQKQGYNILLSDHVGGYSSSAREKTDIFILNKIKDELAKTNK